MREEVFRFTHYFGNKVSSSEKQLSWKYQLRKFTEPWDFFTLVPGKQIILQRHEIALSTQYIYWVEFAMNSQDLEFFTKLWFSKLCKRKQTFCVGGSLESTEIAWKQKVSLPRSEEKRKEFCLNKIFPAPIQFLIHIREAPKTNFR